MKVQVQKAQSETSGIISQDKFDIGNKVLVFEMLRNTMYKSPIDAVCREISCNARDAHREVKNSAPINISLPNWQDHNLRIQDFGPGISPDRMSKVFTKLGNSTKRDSNLETGGFGLGCKTPFSYVDSFSVVTIYNGKKRTYSAYIDDSRLGAMDCMEEKDTTEPNGTTIIVPVKKSDFDKFYLAIKTATQWWDIKPRILNGKINYDSYSTIYSGTNWELYKSNTTDYYARNEAIVLVDGIKYDIDPQHFNTKYSSILKNPFILKFNNGELSLQGSRDAVQFDSKTINAITAKLDLILSELAITINQQISSCATYRLAVNKLNDTLRALNSSESIGIYLKNVKWKNWIVSPTCLVLDQVGPQTKLTQYRYNRTKAVAYNNSNISFLENTIFFYHVDIKTSVGLNQYADELFNSVVDKFNTIVFIQTPEEITKSVWDKNIKEYVEVTEKGNYDLSWFEVWNVKNLSDIKFTPKLRGTRGSFKTNDKIVTVYELQRGSYWNNESCGILRSKEVDNESGGIYVLFNQDRVCEKKFNLSVYENFLGQPIVGVTQKRSKKLSSNWIHLDKAVEDKINLSLQKNTLDEILQLNYDYSIMYNHSVLGNIVKIASKVDNKFLNEYREYKAKAEKSSKNNEKLIIFLNESKTLATQINSESKFLRNLKNEFLTKHPMFKYVTHDIKANAIVDYMNLIEPNSATFTK